MKSRRNARLNCLPCILKPEYLCYKCGDAYCAKHFQRDPDTGSYKCPKADNWYSLCYYKHVSNLGEGGWPGEFIPLVRARSPKFEA